MTVLVARPPARADVARVVSILAVAIILLAVPFGAAVAIPAAGVGFALLVVALLETSRPVLTWTSGVILFIGVAWLIPIKGYALPVDLPFNLEHYRLVLLCLLVLLVGGVVTRRVKLDTAGAGPALLVLGGAAFASAIVNLDDIAAATGDPDAAVKALSYFLSFLIVFVLVTSVIVTREQLDSVVRAVVLGGIIVAGAALYEATFNYNVFDHLHHWLPGFDRLEREILEERHGQVRVYASAQHPIALGVALLLVVPLGAYLMSRAATRARAALWATGTILILVAATATVSRTIVVMAVGMLIVGLLLRGPQVRAYWPLLLVLPFVIHLAAPGAMGGIYKAFTPSAGLFATDDPRAGQGGSGRLADVGPGIDLWLEQPLLGHGLGNQLPTIKHIERTPAREQIPLIFDNQYLGSLVRLGAIGLLGVMLFIWGSAVRLYKGGRRIRTPLGDLVAACAAAAVGFGGAFLLFDAFAFVQATLLFFVVVAIGLRAKAIAERPTIVPPERSAA